MGFRFEISLCEYDTLQPLYILEDSCYSYCIRYIKEEDKYKCGFCHTSCTDSSEWFDCQHVKALYRFMEEYDKFKLKQLRDRQIKTFQISSENKTYDIVVTKISNKRKYKCQSCYMVDSCEFCIHTEIVKAHLYMSGYDSDLD